MNLELEINAVLLAISLGDIKLNDSTNYFKVIARDYAKEKCIEQKKLCREFIEGDVATINTFKHGTTFKLAKKLGSRLEKLTPLVPDINDNKISNNNI